MSPANLPDNLRSSRTRANRHSENGRSQPEQQAAPDAIDRALSAVQPQMANFQMQLPTSGRPCVIVVPIDLDEREALGLHSLINSVYDQLYARRTAAGLITPGGAPLPIKRS